MPGYGTSLGVVLPSIGSDTEAVAASKLNTALSAIISRLEGKVGAADLDLNADVSFRSGATFSGAKDLQRAAFASQAVALTAGSNPNTLYVLNGNLHYIDQAGNLVQITSAGAVNASTTGGITGSGYGTGGVEVNWDSVNTRFALKSGAGADDFADLQVADVLLRDGSGNTIRFQAPAISADYAVSLPAAAPGSTSLLQMTSAGLIQTTLTPSVTTLAVTSTSTFTGVATFNGAIQANSAIRHVTQEFFISAAMGHRMNLGGGANPDNYNTDGALSVGNESVIFPLPLIAGDRVLTIDLLLDTPSALGTRELSLRHTNASGVTSSLSSPTISPAAGFARYTFNVTDTVLASTGMYHLRYTNTGGGTDEVYGFIVSYDHP